MTVMRGFSFKALIVGNLLFFVLAAVAGCTLILAVMLIDSLGPPNGASVHDIIEALTSSQIAVSVLLSAPIIFAAIAAGYIAGNVAANHEQLNGGLATAIWTLMNAYELIDSLMTGSMEPQVAMPKALYFALLFSCPILSALGGYLAKRHRFAVPGSSSASITTDAAVSMASAGVTLARFILGLLVAAVVYAGFVKLAEIVSIADVGGGLVIVFGTIFAITLATSVTPPHQRKLCGFLFIALVVLVSAEELIRNVAAGTLSHVQLFVLFTDIFGAAVSYLALLWAFPRQFQAEAAKWWWLSTYRYAAWSHEERHARNALFITGAVIWVIAYSLAVFVLGWVGVEAHIGAVSAGLLTLPLALFAVRPIYALLRPLELQRADQNAAIRRELAAGS